MTIRTDMISLLRTPVPGRMKHYPADFTPCGCSRYNYGGIAAALVIRHGRTPAEKAVRRRCETCGAEWEGDCKRHRHMPIFRSGKGITYGGRVR